SYRHGPKFAVTELNLLVVILARRLVGLPDGIFAEPFFAVESYAKGFGLGVIEPFAVLGSEDYGLFAELDLSGVGLALFGKCQPFGSAGAGVACDDAELHDGTKVDFDARVAIQP